jgi:hypothetical protein
MPFLFVRDDICRHPETMRTKIGSVSGRDVRHLRPGWRISSPDTEPIPGGVKTGQKVCMRSTQF